MPTRTAMLVACINVDATGTAKSLSFDARVDAVAVSADFTIRAGSSALAAMLRVAFEVDAQDTAAGLAVLNLSVLPGILDVTLDAGDFACGKRAVDGHAPAAEGVAFTDFDVKKGVFRAPGKDELSFVAVARAELMKQALIDARRDEIQICAGAV